MGDTLVLCYHALSERWAADLSVSPARFAEQLEHLRGRGYRGVTFDEAVTGTSRGRRVAVTFDDAFASVGAHARPVLDALGWPGTVFAVTRFASMPEGGPLRWGGIDQWSRTEHAGELAGMAWDDLGRLRDAGWQVGSHTVTHRHLTRLPDEALAHELAGSREAVAEALGDCSAIAYPYGDVDARVVAAARRAGYRTGATLPSHWHLPRSLEHPRPGIYHPDDLWRFRMKTSRAVRRARAATGR